MLVCLEEVPEQAAWVLNAKPPWDFKAIIALASWDDFDRLARTGCMREPNLDDDNDVIRRRALNALAYGRYPPLVMELLREIVAELSL